MIEVEETERGLHVVDDAKNELSIVALDWRSGGQPLKIDRHTGETIAGSVTELEFPGAYVHITSENRNQWRTFDIGSKSLQLERNTHLVQVETTIAAYVKFRGRAVLRWVPNDDAVVLEFPERTSVTLGFRSPVRLPTHRITVPPTPEGMATALTHLASAHETTSPDRSYPTLRRHPPLLEYGDSTDIPDAVLEEMPVTGIELRLPDDFDSLFVAAPLAYYLQSAVVSEPRPAPRLSAPDVDLHYDFDPVPRFQHQAAALLCRVFLLDCLVRNAGPYPTDLAELPLLDEVGIDADETYNASPQQRLKTYLDAPFERVEADLPDWHLSTYVDPTADHAPVLPHLLDRLSLIYLPRTSSLDRGELVARSLDDSYRSTKVGGRDGAVPPIELVLPRLYRGRVHGWIADGVPIDVFKSIPAAYENRLDYVDRNQGPLSVTVVLNDPDMDDEQSAATRIYRERSDELSIDLEIRRELGRTELAGVFERPIDFVHYIGHCDRSGLRCSDGSLAIGDIEESNAQTFFLNACGSYYEGLELIRKGSVAGGVTLNRVLDDQATKVGTAFARLVVHGYDLEQALQLARRRAIVNKHYTVVGDGAHVLSQGDDNFPTVTRIESAGFGEFHIATESFSARETGRFYKSYLDEETVRLIGNEIETTASTEELRSYLRDANIPVIYDGRYYWSEELLAEIEGK